MGFRRRALLGELPPRVVERILALTEQLIQRDELIPILLQRFYDGGQCFRRMFCRIVEQNMEPLRTLGTTF